MARLEREAAKVAAARAALPARVPLGLETTEAELMSTLFPHPTLSEMMHESVLDAYGRALHI